MRDMREYGIICISGNWYSQVAIAETLSLRVTCTYSSHKFIFVYLKIFQYALLNFRKYTNVHIFKNKYVDFKKTKNKI